MAPVLGWLPFSGLSIDTEAESGLRVWWIGAPPFIFHFPIARSLAYEHLGTYPVG